MSNNNRIILVYPANQYKTARPDRPPLGLLTIAGPLLAIGYEVVLLDERAEDDFENRLISELDKGALCVGISSMSGRHIFGALQVCKLIRKKAPSLSIVWGGVQASLEPDSTIRHPLVDFIVRDDGEETFPRLLEYFRDPSIDLTTIHGIGYKKDGQIHFTDTANPADIEKLPPVPFHLVDLKRYQSLELWTEDKTVLPIETSRGCPFSCSFCTESVRKKKWRALPPERVISDIKYYRDTFGIRSFTFIDDNLFGNVKRGRKIVDLMIKENLGITWYTNIRTDFMARVEPEFIRKLENSGCRMLTFGAESGSAEMLKMIEKRASKDNVIQANRNLKQSRIIPHFVTIGGFPTETRDDLAQTFLMNMQLLLENNKAICDFPFLIPTPGTKIAEMCLGEKRKTYTLEDWAKVFDLSVHNRPEWVNKDAFRFIKKFKIARGLISRANRPSSSAAWRFVIRVGLYLVRFILRLGIR